MNNIPVLVTTAQLAKRWGVCVHTIRRNKDLKPIKLGRRLIRYRLSDIEALESEKMSTELDSHTLSNNVPETSGQSLTSPPQREQDFPVSEQPTSNHPQFPEQ